MTPQPLTWARVFLGRQAQEAYARLSDAERARFWRIIQVIRTAPEDGPFVQQLADGTVLRQMTGSNMHITYIVRSWPIGRVLNVVMIEIADWTPIWQ